MFITGRDLKSVHVVQVNSTKFKHWFISKNRYVIYGYTSVSTLQTIQDSFSGIIITLRNHNYNNHPYGSSRKNHMDGPYENSSPSSMEKSATPIPVTSSIPPSNNTVLVDIESAPSSPTQNSELNKCPSTPELMATLSSLSTAELLPPQQERELASL